MRDPKLLLLIAGVCLTDISSGSAQTEIVTLSTTNGPLSPWQFKQMSVMPNQVVNFLYIGYDTNGAHYCRVRLTSGSDIYFGSYKTTTGAEDFAHQGQMTWTGVTNIGLWAQGVATAATFSITTPTSQSYLPANAVVIPTDANGPVQIVLESSSDLVSWTATSPGTYGSTYSNRFFRVRAVAGQ